MELNQIARDGSPPLSLQSSNPPPIPFADVEKEHMFEKVVTPSDVGKLNRLVIPKQYAEKYFPLDASSNEKDLLLNFEDRHGKPWRFRYSYWNSSQSYVMTKGWSRFVKEKRLDAGDTVLFGRGLSEAAKDRLFIDWRRRPDQPHNSQLNPNSYPPMVSFARSVVPWGRFYPPHLPANSCIYVRSTVDVPSRVNRDEPTKFPVIYNSVPVSRANFTGSKRIRLFGVNLDCGPIPGPPSAAQVGTLPPLISLQLSLGGGGGGGGGGVAVADVIDPPEQGKPALSLDLGI